LVAPSSMDRPNEGSIQFTVDLSPAASTSFRQATPAATGGGGTYASGPQLPNADRHQKLTANHILRCLERCLLQGGALDTEALCVVPGAYVWKLSCCCTILDQGGNLTDAAVLACLAAVRHYRKPIVEMTSGDSSVPQLVPSHLKEPTPLPLHHTPLTISFALYDHAVSGAGSVPARVESTTPADHASGWSTFLGLLIDPTAREELCQTGSLVLALNVHAEICLVDFSGGCELSLADLRACHAIAAAHIGPLCQSLESSLAQADEKALTERLALLQKVPLPLPPLPPDGLEEPQLLVQLPASAVTTNPLADYEKAAQDAALAAEEEAYRRQALDYNLGHVATKVRENKDSSRSATTATSSLLKAMLQSVQGDVPVESTPYAEPTEQPPLAPEKPPQKDDCDGATKSAPPAARTSSKTPSNMALDSDEEETTVQLQSEFDTLPLHAMSKAVDASINADVDDDADDLAAAVKSKKKSKKKR
jgi:exosome complex component RRP45